MRRACLTILLMVALGSGPAGAQDKAFTLATSLSNAPGGLLRHILPRFTLKTGIRPEIVAENAPADARLANDGDRAVFQAGKAGPVWYLSVGDDADAARFADWLTGEIGQKAVFAYRRDGAQAYFAIGEVQMEADVVTLDGDAVLGERLALQHCGRCHVISDKNKFGGIGSTPSFGALRTLPGWQDKFAAFWTLNPHPSFTQVEGMTEPFDPLRPPMIAPLEMTLEEAEAIAAYAATIPPKDLGGALTAQ